MEINMPEIIRIENKNFATVSLSNILSEYCKDNTVHTLEIYSSAMSAHEIDTVTSFIAESKSIHTLSMINTQLSGKPLNRFKRILSGKNGIKHIYLSGNQLTIPEIMLMGILDEKNCSLLSCDIFPLMDANNNFKVNSDIIFINLENQKNNDLYFKYVFDKLNLYNGTSKIILNLKNNQLTSSTALLIYSLLTKNILKSINLGRNNFTETDWGYIGNAIATCTLEEFDVSYNNLQDHCLKSLLRNIRNHPTLSTIRAINNNIGDDGAQEIARLMNNNPKIQHIDLSYNNIRALGAAHLSRALQSNKTIKILSLNSNLIGEAGAFSFAQTLQQQASLIVLELYSNNLTNNGVQALVKALQTNKTLRKLNISSNYLTDPVVFDIEELLAANTTLECCDLSENKIEDETLNRLKGNTRVATTYNDTSFNITLSTINTNVTTVDKGSSTPSTPITAHTEQTLVPPMQVNRGYVNAATVTPYSPQINTNVPSSIVYFTTIFSRKSKNKVTPTTSGQPESNDISNIKLS